MRHSAILLLLALFVASCSKSTRYPTLVIDQEHEMVGTNPYALYQINASPGVRLDETQFHFTFGTNAVSPNMIQFIGSNSLYKLSCPTETNIYVIDATTLETVHGEAFHGFRTGDKLFFAIGSVTNEEDFWVSWVGQIQVK